MEQERFLQRLEVPPLLLLEGFQEVKAQGGDKVVPRLMKKKKEKGRRSESAL